MKTNRLFPYLLLSLFLALFLNSCDLKKDDDPLEPANEFLISNELKTTITAQQAIAKFTSLSPEAAAGIGFLIRTDIDVYKVIYKTTYKDEPIQASGLVCMPKTPGDYPIFSFQNGTNTEHSKAPTEAYDDDLYGIIESISNMNYIVVIPDYIGFGVSSNRPHPYLDKESTTQSIIDLIRAAKELGNDENVVAKATNDLFIFGYSQGGWATMALQKEIETNYESEFNLKGSSCGAGPYSIEFLNSQIISQTTYPSPYFLAYVLNSYKATGTITNPLSDFFNEPYATIIPGLFDGTHTGGEINAQLTTSLTALLTPEYRNEFNTNPKFSGLKTALTVNSIRAWNTSTPTKLYHGRLDEVIPVGMTEKMLADFLKEGVPASKIEQVLIDDVDHTGGVYPTGMQTILWFLSLK